MIIHPFVKAKRDVCFQLSWGNLLTMKDGTYEKKYNKYIITLLAIYICRFIFFVLKWTWLLQPFQRDSMLVFAGGQDVWMLMEVARGCHNSAVACLTLHLGSDKDIYETPGKVLCILNIAYRTTVNITIE